jgi:hypothetical protein
MRRAAEWLFICVVAAALTYQLAMAVCVFIAPSLADVRLGGLGEDPSAELVAMHNPAPGSPLEQLALIREARQVLPQDALVLVFDQNAFAYYGGRQTIRDVDPRMIPFYLAKDRAAALAQLHALGITDFYLPPWSWPTIDHSLIKAIAGDPTVARTLVERAGYKLVELLPERVR